jgi:hypothetical protein
MTWFLCNSLLPCVVLKVMSYTKLPILPMGCIKSTLFDGFGQVLPDSIYPYDWLCHHDHPTVCCICRVRVA